MNKGPFSSQIILPPGPEILQKETTQTRSPLGGNVAGSPWHVNYVNLMKTFTIGNAILTFLGAHYTFSSNNSFQESLGAW